MRIRHEREFPIGYTEIGAHHAESLMDFGILRLKAGQAHRSRPGKERAFILLNGAVDLAWEGHTVRAARGSVFDESPWCLSLTSNAEASITAVDGEAEISVHATQNPRSFPSHLYTPDECRSEERGKGTMKETSTRIVRTIMEDPRAPCPTSSWARWSRSPASGPAIPLITTRSPKSITTGSAARGGFGLCQIGEEAYFVVDKDTVIIPPGAVHPHVAAPGYAMFYIWVIRHLDEARYGTPTFVPEHSWVMDPKAKIWA